MLLPLPLVNLEQDQEFDAVLVQLLCKILDFLPNLEAWLSFPQGSPRQIDFPASNLESENMKNLDAKLPLQKVIFENERG